LPVLGIGPFVLVGSCARAVQRQAGQGFHLNRDRLRTCPKKAGASVCPGDGNGKIFLIPGPVNAGLGMNK